MQKLFNKILVPIDFSRVSESALEKAAEMAAVYDCDIYLLHVVSVSPFAVVAMAEGRLWVPFEAVDNKPALEASLKRLADRYASKIPPGRQIVSDVQKGLWNEAIVEYAADKGIDLILVGQKESFFRKRELMIDANGIAERTYVPVITVPGNRRLIRLFSIVIPVTDFLPVKKLMYGVYMARQHPRTSIKLLGIEESGNAEYNRKVDHYLQKAFQLIRDNCEVPVEIGRVKASNVADAVNAFACRHAADLVIVNPGRQTKMPGILSTLMGNVLQKYSDPPVLTVSAV